MLMLASEGSTLWSWLEHVSVSYHVLELFWTIGLILFAARYAYFDLRDRLRRNNYTIVEFSLVTLAQMSRGVETMPHYRMRMRPISRQTVIDAVGGDQKLAKLFSRVARAAAPGQLLRFSGRVHAGDICSQLRTTIDLICAETRIKQAASGSMPDEQEFVFFAACEQSLRARSNTGALRQRVIVLSRADFECLVKLRRAQQNLCESLVRDADDVPQAAIVRRARTLESICDSVSGFAETLDHGIKQGFCVGALKLAV